MNIVAVLKQEEAKLQHQLKALQEAIAALNGGRNSTSSTKSNSNGQLRRVLSPAGRARISRAAKARWAKVRAEKANKKN